MIESFKYCQKEKGLEIGAGCIMTTHLHIIARAKEGYELSNIIRDFKKHTSKTLIKAIHSEIESRKEWMLEIFKNAGRENIKNKEFQIWRNDNHPIELFSPKVTQQKLDYIHRNPVEAGFVENEYDYLYASARDYAGLKGLLEVVFL